MIYETESDVSSKAPRPLTSRRDSKFCVLLTALPTLAMLVRDFDYLVCISQVKRTDKSVTLWKKVASKTAL